MSASGTIGSISVHGAELSRRSVLAMGGVLMVGFGIAPTDDAQAAGTTLNPKLSGSWLEIRPDNKVLIRTGKCDFGQSSIYTAYRQIVAEELDLPFEAVTTVVTGDTDRTPDGGGTFDLLGSGTPNLRKVAAYTREALLELASQRLSVAKDKLTIQDGIVSGAGKQISYGELVKDQSFRLTIPVKGELTSIFGLVVDGNPPLKPVSDYKIVGKPFKNSVVVPKVTAKETWVTNVKLPGMLHARTIHPKSLGSMLVAAGQLDKGKFPTAQLVVKGNLVAVVSPSEWEAVQASRQVAAATKWSDWKGLPGTSGLFDHLRKNADWKAVPVDRSKPSGGDVPAAMAGAAKKHSASYEVPYLKHAPIGPTMALADARPDGSVTLHSHTQNPQALRGQIALMLGIPVGKVVIRTYSGAGHYGRSNGGNAGAEDEAVLLSKALGKPVRVQWMRAEDMQWSTQSSAAFSEISIGLDANGKIAAYEADHYMPAMQDDRPIGAVLAGLPTMPAPNEKAKDLYTTANSISDDWVYDVVPNLDERARGTWQVGQRESPLNVGLRNHSMRTPGQFQQNFPREVAMSEAAALAGADPLQFRIDHAKAERLKSLLERLRAESGWQTRPSPNPQAASGDMLRGQGVSVMLRAGSYWACACKIALTPSTGQITVEKITMAVDPGIVVNPLQLKRQVEGGTMMGVSEALYEEVAFDESAVTTQDWRSYPILKMGDIPEVKVVLVNRPEVGSYGQGSEGANALAAPAIAAAVFDATGKPARRLPLKPAYVMSLLRA
ncbi:MAG TPA: molybdopterin cofactor-binding domain-containing protein [Rhizomicrobium sp.]|nr:molybdopterin cofactor-binding domain-containing protein [Rhizomicrobium sp.]